MRYVNLIQEEIIMRSKLTSRFTIIFFLFILIFSLTIPAFANIYPDIVLDYMQGENVEFPYNVPEEALGPPERLSIPISPDRATWVSLGFGGYLEVALSKHVMLDGPGVDIRIYEVGTGEKSNVYVSDDYGQTWVYLGTVLSNGTESLLDFADIGIDRVNAIRIEDGGEAEYGAPYAGADVDCVTGHFYEEIDTIYIPPSEPDPIEEEVIENPVETVNPVVTCDTLTEELIIPYEDAFHEVEDINTLIIILEDELEQILCKNEEIKHLRAQIRAAERVKEWRGRHHGQGNDHNDNGKHNGSDNGKKKGQ